MTGSSDNNMNFERLIAEARAASEVGVFGRTQVDIADLAAAPRPSLAVRFYERAMVGLPLAACLAIMVGIATWGIQPGTVDRPVILAVNGSDVEVEPCGIEMFAHCVSGPGQPMAPGCSCADLDRDGDVDLADIGSFQVSRSTVP
jgi:hypothetical protein